MPTADIRFRHRGPVEKLVRKAGREWSIRTLGSGRDKGMILIGRLMILACCALLLVPLPAGAADTLKIGMSAILTGPTAESGHHRLNGARLAADGINKAGGVLGKPIELVVEDDQATNPGAILAFSKLAADPAIVAFVGPNPSTQLQAIAPDVMKAGKPMMIGGTDPKLTHFGNPWLFRCRPNDIYSARVIADFGV